MPPKHTKHARKPKPRTAKTSLSLSAEILERGKARALDLGCRDFSGYVNDLIREDLIKGGPRTQTSATQAGIKWLL